MKKLDTNFTYIILAILFIGLLVWFVISIQSNLREGDGQENAKQIEATQEAENTDENGYWVGYGKPEGWITVVNEEFGFSVDIPAELKDQVNLQQTNIAYSDKGIFIRDADLFSVTFAINTHDISDLNKDGYPRLLEDQFHVLEGNQKKIQEGGNAFKYFRYAYLIYTKTAIDGDDFLTYYNKDEMNWDEIKKDPFIRISLRDENSENYEEYLETIRKIIKSFRKL